jgi:hypothetical protein
MKYYIWNVVRLIAQTQTYYRQFSKILLMKAAQNDPTVSDSLKGVLSVMSECLAQQAASM